MERAGNGNAECGVPNAEWKKGTKKFQIPNSEFGMPDQPAPLCGSKAKPPGKGLTQSMLSAGNALDPGPRV